MSTLVVRRVTGCEPDYTLRGVDIPQPWRQPGRRTMAVTMTESPAVLVPLDLECGSEAAVPGATDYARLLGATVVLLHVLPRGQLDPALVGRSEASARTYLDAIAAQVEASGASAAAVVRGGSPSAVIVAEAALLEARLIVLSVSRRRHLVNAVRPGMAEQVARGATCPVLLVRPQATAGASGDPLRSFADDAGRAGALVRRHLG